MTDGSRAAASVGAADLLALAGRLMVGPLFVMSAVGKITNPDRTIEGIAATGMSFPQAAYAAALFVEIVGAILVMVGWKTRYGAAMLALFCLLAGLMFHSDFGDRAQTVQFLKNLAITGGLLHLAAYGGGRIAIDRS